MMIPPADFFSSSTRLTIQNVLRDARKSTRNIVLVVTASKQFAFGVCPNATNDFTWHETKLTPVCPA
jgi:hypothetical protein